MEHTPALGWIANIVIIIIIVIGIVIPPGLLISVIIDFFKYLKNIFRKRKETQKTH